MPKIRVDEDVYNMLEFGRELTGWTYSEVIARAAAVKRDKLLAEAEALRGLAEIAPEPPEYSEPPRVEVRHGAQSTTIVVNDEQPLAIPTTTGVAATGEEDAEGVSEEGGATGDMPEVITSDEGRRRILHRLAPEDFRKMVRAEFIKPGQRFRAELADGTVYNFVVGENLDLRHNGESYDSPSAALKAAHGTPLNAWDYIKNYKNESLRELCERFGKEYVAF